MNTLPQPSTANHTRTANLTCTPPSVTVPRHYNAAYDLLQRHTQRASKAAFIDSVTGHTLTYGHLSAQSYQFANALRALGFAPESRVLLCALDTTEWPVAFLGCLLAGVVPVAVNTLLTTKDFDFMLRDSRAQGLIVSHALLPAFDSLIGQIDTLKTVIVCGVPADNNSSNTAQQLQGKYAFETVVYAQAATQLVADTCSDDAAFWLYSSGSTGAPKGTVHLHSHLIQTAQLYGQGVLGIQEHDVVYSAAKFFFAYGLGNSLTFPLAVGATAVLLHSRPTPADVFSVLQKYQPSIFYGVPTLYAALLADTARPAKAALHLRVCTSAGEALPADIGKRWSAEYGCEVLDGIGSTEMLHIFLSNRPGHVPRPQAPTAAIAHRRRQ